MITRSGLHTKTILALFLARVVFGILIAYFAVKYYPPLDSLSLNSISELEYENLKKDPGHFFTETLDAYKTYPAGGYFETEHSYWNDLKLTLLTKCLAPFQFFTRGNFYINTLLFIFISFFGKIFLYRLVKEKMKKPGALMIAACFFLPSTFIFSAALHKDAIVFTALCGYLYAVYMWLKRKEELKAIILGLFCLLVIVLLRNYIIIALIPLSLWVGLTVRYGWRPFLSLGFTLLAGIFVTWALTYNSLNPLVLISAHNEAFVKVGEGSTQLPALQIEPHFQSLASNLPQAIDYGFLQPHLYYRFPWAGTLFSLEMMLIFFLGIYSIFVAVKNRPVRPKPYLVFMFVFAIIMILVTGYIVANIGAIVRYRSLYLPFIVVPLLYTIINTKYYKK